jgi:DNA polymerase-4
VAAAVVQAWVAMGRPAEPILHVDLDAFYASVEVLKEPSLAGRPVVVGGSGSRGVVMSASYEARRYSIHSAMPAVRARRLCPDAVFVPPDFESYRAHSNRFREVLLSYTPTVEPIALDEAFLDVGGAGRLFGEPPRIGERIREDVRSEVGVRCSVGVAPNKLIAKLASRHAKPDGLVHARDLHALARGIDPRDVVPYEPPKSVSHEETFDVDIDAEEEVLREALSSSHRVAARLRQDGYRARTVVLKIRLANFTTLTRSRTLPAPTDLAADLYRVAAELYRGLPGARRRVRLLGVQATGLVPAGAEQLALMRGDRWSEVERALDRIDRRFGRGSAGPATLLGRRRDR